MATNPGQGYLQSHIDRAPSPSQSMDSNSSFTTPTRPTSRPITKIYIPHDQRDGPFNVTPGSPPKRQSPLRQSISYTDPYEQQEPIFTSSDRHTRFTKGHSRSRSEVTTVSFAGYKDARRHSASQDANLSWNMPRNTTMNDTGTRRVPQASNLTRSKGASLGEGSRFSFFTSRMPTLKALSPSPVSVPQNDELINLDIEKALFPNGPPDDGQTFSPSSFKNLQIAATGLLNKFQGAYQNQATKLLELTAEHEAQDEERAEADTRTRHLKMQLEDMARKASETESIMQALMEELNQEKRLRMEERAAREKAMSPSEGSISEDLGVDEDQQKRRWRRSGETLKSDLGFETDEDSVEGASIFSRPRSPTLTAPSIMSDTSHLDCSPMAPPSRQSSFVQSRPPRQAQPQMTTFQKIFKGISGDAKDAGAGGANGCQNCQGQDASMAWDTVSLLRVENKTLKERVGELEDAVEVALDVVNGVGQ